MFPLLSLEPDSSAAWYLLRLEEFFFFLTFWASWLCVQLCPKMEPLSCVLRGKNNHSRTKVIHLSLCQRKADEESKRVKTYYDHWETSLLEATLFGLMIFFMPPFFFTRASVLLACIQKPAAVFSHNDLLNLSSLQKTKSIYSSVPAIGASDFTILSNESFIFLGTVVPRLHEAFTSLDRGALLLSRPYCTYYHNYTGLNGSIIA